MPNTRPPDKNLMIGHHRVDMGLASRVRRMQEQWIEAMLVHHRLVLIVGALLTAIAVWGAVHLELDSDLRRLLSKKEQVVQRLEEIEEGFGTLGSIDVVVREGTPEVRHAFAEAIVDGLSDHELITRVDASPETDFFAEHALYYLSDPDMEELADRIMGVEHFALCSSAPDICIDDPDPKANEKLREFVDQKRTEAKERAGFEQYYEREGIEALVVFLRPTESADDVRYDMLVTDAMRAELARIHAEGGAWTGTDMTYNIIGPYVGRSEERRAVPHDMLRSGAVGLIGVILILYFLFRSFRAVVTLLVPLLVGVAWSMGVTQVVLGHLNAMTSLISTVVLGVGIDAGIHLLTKVRLELEEHTSHEAIKRAFGQLIVPLLVASSTTVGAFVVMTTSEFPVFQEFGIIGACGVGLCLVSMLTVFPALLALVGVPSARKRAKGRNTASLVRVMLARPGLVSLLILALIGGSWLGIAKILEHGFEYNGRLLSSDRVRATVEEDNALVQEIFAKDIHPSILLVDDYETLEQTFATAVEAQAKLAETGDSVVAELVSAVSLMPEGVDMEQRHASIEELTEDFSETTWARIEGREAVDEFGDPLDGGGDREPDENAMSEQEAKRLRRMLEAKPFTIEDLPATTLERVRTKDGKWAIFGYSTFDRGDMLYGVKLMDETAAYGPPGTPYVGEATVYAAMYMTMTREWVPVLGLAAGVVVLLVFAQLRSLRQTLMAVAPVAVGLWWLFALMGLLTVRFTLFNVPIFPAILGIGVDHGVYLAVSIAATRGAPEKLPRAVDETGRAILAASATTALGFGSFMVADSGGLRSIGAVAVIGIVTTALAALLILPTLAALGRRGSSG